MNGIPVTEWAQGHMGLWWWRPARVEAGTVVPTGPWCLSIAKNPGPVWWLLGLAAGRSDLATWAIVGVFVVVWRAAVWATNDNAPPVPR